MTDGEERTPEFGDYLREAREAIGATVRTAAAQVGLSFGHLAKLERSEVTSPPSIHTLARMAALYGKTDEEMMSRAGVRPVDPVKEATGEVEAFRRLMLSVEFGPVTMKEEYLSHFPALHRVLIQQIVAATERHTEARVRWELRGDGDAPCPPPLSMRTLAEVIGAVGTVQATDEERPR